MKGQEALRLHLILPNLEPALVRRPTACPHCGCGGGCLERYQQVAKPVQDMGDRKVPTVRYRCPQCGRTFRAYPDGIDHAPTSRRLKDLAVALYLLGLSCEAVSETLSVLGLYISKTRVHAEVQATVNGSSDLFRCAILTGFRNPNGSGREAAVQCDGRWLPVRLAVDDASGLVLEIDGLPAESANTLQTYAGCLRGTINVRLLLTRNH